MNDYERILDGTSLENVIGRHVVLSHASETAIGCCPFGHCGTASLTVYKKQRVYYCSGCGATGDAVDFLQKVLDIGRHEALSEVARIGGVMAPIAEPNALAIGKEEAVAAIWEFCGQPAQNAAMLQDRGWATRSYDAEMLEMALSTLGSLGDAITKSGIAQPSRTGRQNSPAFRPYDDAFVLAGRRLIGNGPAITGFTVVAGLNKMHVVQRMSSATSPASVIVNDDTLTRRTLLKRVFITDSPLRAVKANRRIAALSPASLHWRPQDVRDVMAAFPNAIFVLDIQHISDISLQEWALQSRDHATRLEALPDFLADPQYDINRFEDQTVGRLASALRAASTTQTLLGSLLKPATSGSGASSSKAASHATQVVAPSYLLGTSSCLLESALLHLPMVDPALWDSIPVDEFGEHAAIAAALSAFRNDATMSRIEPHRAHAAFWVYVQRFNASAVPQALVNFWQTRLAQNALYWQPIPDPSSIEGKMCAEEISALLSFFSGRIARRRRFAAPQGVHPEMITNQARSDYAGAARTGTGT